VLLAWCWGRERGLRAGGGRSPEADLTTQWSGRATAYAFCQARVGALWPAAHRGRSVLIFSVLMCVRRDAVGSDAGGSYDASQWLGT
jgi:hypothetical protein